LLGRRKKIKCVFLSSASCAKCFLTGESCVGLRLKQGSSTLSAKQFKALQDGMTLKERVHRLECIVETLLASDSRGDGPTTTSISEKSGTAESFSSPDPEKLLHGREREQEGSHSSNHNPTGGIARLKEEPTTPAFRESVYSGEHDGPLIRTSSLRSQSALEELHSPDTAERPATIHQRSHAINSPQGLERITHGQWQMTSAQYYSHAFVSPSSFRRSSTSHSTAPNTHSPSCESYAGWAETKLALQDDAGLYLGAVPGPVMQTDGHITSHQVPSSSMSHRPMVSSSAHVGSSEPSSSSSSLYFGNYPIWVNEGSEGIWMYR